MLRAFIADLEPSVSTNSGSTPCAKLQSWLRRGENITMELGLTEMDYNRVCCPVAEEILATCIRLPVNEAFGQQSPQEVGDAISKVANFYAK